MSDRYQIVDLIGEGGMASVYLAEDTTLHRKVAVKVLRRELARALGADRFLREIDITAKLDHPHIVPIYDAGESDGVFYYVMRHVDGQSLADVVRSRGELPIEEAARFLRDVAEGLADAHAKGVVHRDIKPDNVLISGRHAAVTDFGIAKAVTEATSWQSLTETGVTLGTPAYMAPEQVTADAHLDERVDVYAFGALAYELFTGRPPFDGNTSQQVMAAHVNRAPVPITKHRPTVPTEWNALVMRCLEKRPADRWQNARELLEAIETIPTGTIGSQAQPANRRSTAGLGIAGAAIVVVGLVAWLVLGRSATSAPERELHANTIAVLPFTPSTPDTALVRLGRDVALTLSYNLDGLGGLTTADVHAILARATERETGMPAHEAIALAADYGAGRVLRGNLFQVGSGIRVEVTLQSVESGNTLARAELETDPSDYRALTDSLTRLLLPQLWNEGDRPSLRLNAVLDRPLEAVRAFLDGERAYAQGLFTTAESHYLRAIEADSAFWLAYVRYSSSRGWNLKDSPAWVSAVRDHLDELPERDRLIIEAARLSDPARTDTLELLVRLHQDYSPIVMDYGERLIHRGAYHGRRIDDAVVAFRRVADLNPRFFPAWFHLASAAILASDTSTARDAIEHIEALGIERAVQEDWGYSELALLRLEYAALVRAVDVERQLIEVGTELANARPSWDPEQHVISYRLATNAAAPQLNRRLNDIVIASTSSPEIVRAHRRATVLGTVSRGAWDSALVMIETFERAGQYSNASLDAYRLAAVGEWLGALETHWADERRPAALRNAADPRTRAEVAWLDGLLAFARDDAAAIALARRTLDSAGYDSIGTRLLRQSLEAFELRFRGDVGPAAARLAQLEEGYQHFRYRPPFLSSVNRLAAARWMMATGDTARAERLLQFPDGLLNNLGIHAAGMAMAPMSLIERARIADAQGRSVAAIRYYERFLKFYDLPSNEAGQQLQTEAEDALARLRGLREPGSGS